MSAAPVLEVIDLVKSFGSTHVLRRASLRLTAGSVLGFVGPNGAGKSTCVRCIVGVAFADYRPVLLAIGRSPSAIIPTVRRT